MSKSRRPQSSWDALDNNRHRQPYSAVPLNQDGRIALAVEYVGSDYCGWQRQTNCNIPSVQGTLERALSKVANRPVQVHCAGRTDSGVHAGHQVVHFDPGVARSSKAWVLGGNMNLPDSIAIKWAVPVANDFHARFSARYRRYRYIIDNCTHRPALMSPLLLWRRDHLDVALMHEASQALLGEADFSAFRAAGCQSRTARRNVDFVCVSRYQRLLIIDIQANAFLHHMVRNIVGSLLEIGAGRREVGWLKTLLISKDRTKAGATAPPEGLYLVDVGYPEVHALPLNTPGPVFLPCTDNGASGT
ncbi:MAG: tRNA pseudouridine38-40 synthase [Halieaceae bacterium]|jgi:tRNA pseudouridine38-40 synthase